MNKKIKRCGWVINGSQIYEKYHDTEWGVPVYNDRKIFEFLVLESAQAGLSWITILKKRENYRKAFANFNPTKVSKFNKKDIARLMKDGGIIRNRLKIESAIQNAKQFLSIQKEYGTFSKYIWSFVQNKTIQGSRKTLKDLPAKTKESEELAKDLKRRGFHFLGPTICYAHMQATGMVNDHTKDCFRWKEIQKLAPKN